MGEGPQTALGGAQAAALHSRLSLQGRSELPKTPTSARPPGSWPRCPPLSCVSDWPAAATPPTPSTSASPGRRSTAPVGGSPGRPSSSPSRAEAALSKILSVFSPKLHARVKATCPLVRTVSAVGLGLQPSAIQAWGPRLWSGIGWVQEGRFSADWPSPGDPLAGGCLD